MSLTVYRRHLSACPHNAGRRRGSGSMDCNCPLWFYGETSKHIYKRQAFHTSDIRIAHARIRQIEIEDGDIVIPEPPKEGATIEDCIRRFLLARRSELGNRTQRSYEVQLGRLSYYCAKRGVTRITGLTVDLLEDFKVEGLPVTLEDSARAGIVNKVRAFLRVAYRREWIDVDLAQRMRAHVFEHEQKSPFSDEEITKILEAAEKMNSGRGGFASQPHTFRLLLDLMLATGLRVSDAIRFDHRNLQRGDAGLWVYPYSPRKRRKTKRGSIVDVYIPEDLKVAIDKCHWMSKELPFWYGGPESRGYSIAQQVYERMQAIGLTCGVSDCRPHRLRDTFAVRALLRGISIGDVSRLLGHSSVRVTEQYYAAWVPARGRRLEAIVAKSLVHGAGDGGGDK